jgi:2-polyprenyl-3-methyl-5-hydroxy-6-metoxy-1,4-benzoquinol methylase
MISHNKYIKKRNNCRLCNSKKVKIILPMPKSEPTDNFRKSRFKDKKLPATKIDVYQCKDCGHVQLLDVINNKVLWKKHIYKSISSPDLKNHFEKYCKFLFYKDYIKKNQRVLDIGSNDGLFLDYLKKKKIKTYGIDPTSAAVKISIKKGHKVIDDFLTPVSTNKIKSKFSKNFSLITANNVFSHSDNLQLMLKCISKLLSHKSYYVFEVSYLLDTIKNRVIDFVYHEHLSYHSIKSLLPFLSKENLFIYDVLRIRTKGGSIRVICGKNKKLENKSLIKKLISSEKKAGLYNDPLYKKIFKEMKFSKKITHNWIKKEKIKNPNIKFYGFGAYSSGTVLLRLLNLEKKLTALVDENIDKLNHLAPNSNLSVIPVEKLPKNEKKIIFILAWRYKNDILRKLKNYDKKNSIIVSLKPCMKQIKKL